MRPSNKRHSGRAKDGHRSEFGINIVDLGLVYHAALTANGMEIELTMTTPACPLGEMMTEEIKLVLRDRFPDVMPSLGWWELRVA